MKLEDFFIGNNWNSFLSFRSRRLKGMQTGIIALDKALLGLGGVTAIQGAPGTCKSSLALQIAAYNANLGTPVIILDRENGKERFRLRLVCCHNQKSSVDVLTCSEDDLANWVMPVAKLPIYHFTDAIKPDQIKDIVQQAIDTFNRPVLLVVDSLQAMPPLAENERMSIQYWLLALDQLKLDFEGMLTIVATSEKSRGADNYDKASMSAAKGTGTIEYKTEVLLDLRMSKDGNLIIEVVKNRDGVANVAVDLVKVLADNKNKGSFCFRLDSE